MNESFLFDYETSSYDAAYPKSFRDTIARPHFPLNLDRTTDVYRHDYYDHVQMIQTNLKEVLEVINEPMSTFRRNECTVTIGRNLHRRDNRLSFQETFLSMLEIKKEK